MRKMPFFDALCAVGVNLQRIRLTKGSLEFIFKGKNILDSIPRDIPFCYFFGVDDTFTLSMSIHDFVRLMRKYFIYEQEKPTA